MCIAQLLFKGHIRRKTWTKNWVNLNSTGSSSIISSLAMIGKYQNVANIS